MKLRVKNTPFWGEVTNTGGTADAPLIELTMKDKSVSYYNRKDLTDKTLKQSAEDFMWSVFVKEGSRKNQFLFLGIILFIGFFLGACTFLFR